MQTAPRAFTIEQLDLPSAPEPLVAEVAALRNALQREYLPDDPPVPAVAIAARARARPKMFRMREWLARDAAGTVVAQASLGQFVADTNKHLRDADVPDALVRNVIVAYDTMNTAPRGEAGMEDWHHTPELIRDWDRSRREAGRERRLALAIDEATGDTAGFTELTYDPKIPHVISQQGTAVIPAHRGRGLGKWLKAAMLERALREWPNARFVRTGNADANAPMLAINPRLGFAPAWAPIIWEIR